MQLTCMDMHARNNALAFQNQVRATNREFCYTSLPLSPINTFPIESDAVTHTHTYLAVGDAGVL